MRRASVAAPGVAEAEFGAVAGLWQLSVASQDRGAPDLTARAATLVPVDEVGGKPRDLQGAAQLAAPGDAGALGIALLADKATVIDDRPSKADSWHAALASLLQAGRWQGFAPDAVRRQQGDADVRGGTDTRSNEAGLERLRAQLRQGGVDATIQFARSARRRPMHGEDARTALERMAASHSDVKIGPNFVVLAGDLRVEVRHVCRAGLDAVWLMQSALSGWRR